MQTRWKARVTDGVLIFEDPNGFVDLLEKWEGRKVSVAVGSRRRRTSNPQLRYYFAVPVKILCDYTGFGKEAMDVLLKQRFLSDLKVVNGKTYLVPLSKTEVSTERFIRFLDDIQKWAAEEFDLYIPDPEEVDYEDYID